LIEYIAAAKKLVYSLKQRILASNNADATKNGIVLLYVSNAFIPSYKFKLKKLEVLFQITHSMWPKNKSVAEMKEAEPYLGLPLKSDVSQNTVILRTANSN